MRLAMHLILALAFVLSLGAVELLAAEHYAGRYSWSQKGGGKSGQKGPVSCSMSQAEDGSWTISYDSTYQGKSHPYIGSLRPDPKDARVLVGEAKQKKGKTGYYVRATISDKGGFRGVAYLGKDKKGGFKNQIATFELKKKG